MSVWNVVRDQPGHEQPRQVLSWLTACEPNTPMATETKWWELLQPLGFGDDRSMVCSSLLCLFSSFLPLVRCFVLSFVWFYYIAVVLTAVRSLSCKQKDMPFEMCICELLLLS